MCVEKYVRQNHLFMRILKSITIASKYRNHWNAGRLLFPRVSTLSTVYFAI